MNVPLTLDRFWATLIEEPNTGCWIWLGSRTKGGYCQVKIGYKHVYVHRWAFEQFRGPIPAGLSIDHLCRTRSCVNPAHMQAVTHADNVRRSVSATKTQCRLGHELARGKNQRFCPVCQRESRRRYEIRQKERLHG
jgi:HNH endonuclease